MARERSSTATFRCDARSVIVTYAARHQWSLTAAGRSWSGSHEEVAAAIRDALGLAGEVPYNTKVIEVAAPGVRGTISNNAFPTDLWFLNLDGDGSRAAAEKGVEAAIMVCLVALNLTPKTHASARFEPLERDRFGRAVFDAATDSGAWARDLAETLSDRLRRAVDAEDETRKIVRELESLGHDLGCWDENGEDFSIYTNVKPPRGRRLTIQFTYVAYEEPFVEVTAQEPS